MDLVTDELANIESWPTHDLFDSLTNVNEINSAQSMNIFPNPSNGTFYISSNSDIQSIEIYNQHGNLVYADPDIKNRNTCLVSLNGLQKGMFLVKAINGNKYLLKKIIVK